MDPKQHIREKYEHVFTPGAPIDNKQMLFGREQEYLDLVNAIKRKGQHAIVIGDRGVGKTSLVKTALKQLQKDNNLYFSIRGCDPNSTWENTFSDLIKHSGFEIRKRDTEYESKNLTQVKADLKIIGGQKETEEKLTDKYISKESNLTPWEVFQFYDKAQMKYVLVLDEYDSVHQSKEQNNFHTNTAYTIKNFADNSDSCNSKIVIVGVAQSSDELIGKHISIERNLREIYLRPIKKAHIYEYFSFVEDFLKISIIESVKKDIVESSLGYPYFFHLVGLEAIEAMLSRNHTNDLVVNQEDYNKAIDRAINQAFQAELSKYKTLFFGKVSDTDERDLLIALASISEYPTSRLRLKEYYNNSIKHIRQFDEVLMSLIQEKQVIHLSRTKDDVRFFDPLLRPFVRKFYKLGIFPKPKNPTLFDDQPEW